MTNQVESAEDAAHRFAKLLVHQEAINTDLLEELKYIIDAYKTALASLGLNPEGSAIVQHAQEVLEKAQ